MDATIRQRCALVWACLCTTLILAAEPAPVLGEDCTEVAWENPCAPGGSTVTDCNLEWILAPSAVPARGVSSLGIPRGEVICYEGDPRCDADADLGNMSCTFAAIPCINNEDPRLPRCAPSAVEYFEIGSVARDAVDEANWAALQGRFGAGGLGLNVITHPPRGPSTVILPGVINATPNLCAAPVHLRVPLKLVGSRVVKSKRKIRTKVVSAAGRSDKDILTLQCRPSSCGDGVIQADHEQCDDGNRANDDGCNQGCQIEGLEPPTPTPTSTRTETPTPLPPGEPTATVTASATATYTEAPVPITRRCNFRTGTNNTGLTVQGNVTANASNVSGFQDWEFFPRNANGVGEIRIPKDQMQFGCGLVQATVLITITAGIVCIRPDFEAGDGFGVIDCNGGNETGYNSATVVDHNTNQNGVGFPMDPECEEVFITPDGLISRASIEDPSEPYHAGVCNSAVHLSYSGNYPANGMTLTQKLIARINTDVTSCSGNPCPANNTPFENGSGDIAVTGRLTTGQSVGTLHNRNNNQTATNFSRTFNGTPVNCNTIYSPTGNVTNMKIGVVIPFPDTAATINDGQVEVRLVCQ